MITIYREIFTRAKLLFLQKKKYDARPHSNDYMWTWQLQRNDEVKKPTRLCLSVVWRSLHLPKYLDCCHGQDCWTDEEFLMALLAFCIAANWFCLQWPLRIASESQRYGQKSVRHFMSTAHHNRQTDCRELSLHVDTCSYWCTHT